MIFGVTGRCFLGWMSGVAWADTAFLRVVIARDPHPDAVLWGCLAAFAALASLGTATWMVLFGWRGDRP